MPITQVTQDPDALSLTVVGEYPVSRRRLWQAWVDPRQLEQFWGPPTWPATFTRHEVFPGGRSHYFMRGPDGTMSPGYWEFTCVQEGHSFEVINGFANQDETINEDLPTMRMSIRFEGDATSSRFIATTSYNSLEEMEQMVAMGMAEGMREAVSQMDAVLADLTTFSAEVPARAQLLGPHKVRISRVIDGPVDLVWRAHHEPNLLRTWLLGPDGWRMTVCEVATTPGQSYRYEWASDNNEPGFGFTGELLTMTAPFHEVTTEQMIGVQGEPSRNELTLSPFGKATLLTLVITYPSQEVRDMVLGTGMTEGMETSYRRLEREVLQAA